MIDCVQKGESFNWKLHKGLLGSQIFVKTVNLVGILYFLYVDSSMFVLLWQIKIRLNIFSCCFCLLGKGHSHVFSNKSPGPNRAY